MLYQQHLRYKCLSNIQRSVRNVRKTWSSERTNFQVRTQWKEAKTVVNQGEISNCTGQQRQNTRTQLNSQNIQRSSWYKQKQGSFPFDVEQRANIIVWRKASESWLQRVLHQRRFGFTPRLLRNDEGWWKKRKEKLIWLRISKMGQ